MKKIIVIGAGAAGMMAAVLLGEAGYHVTVLEQNERLGKKLYITGKGRCNFTNDCDREAFLDSVVTNPRFLYSAYDVLNPQETIGLFEKWGMKTKVERGNRAFPASDKSADVIDTLRDRMKKNKVRVMLNTRVLKILTDESRSHVLGVLAHEARPGKPGQDMEIRADRVIVATGGLSYHTTGATGDGYRFAEQTGHKVSALRPSLVPISCRGDICRDLQGLSLKNVTLNIKKGKKMLYSEMGEMLFTHFGVSGPLVLSASARIGRYLGGSGEDGLDVWIDLKPALTREQFEGRIMRLFDANRKKSLKNVIAELYPAKLLPVILKIAQLDPDRKICDIKKSEREALVRVTRHFPLFFESLRGYNEAVITQGGVLVKEVGPKSMESKKVAGLYFIGEVLDLDALTGGFNLQIAWSTAAACAQAIKEEDMV